jgi:hypothetical protein
MEKLAGHKACELFVIRDKYHRPIPARVTTFAAIALLVKLYYILSSWRSLVISHPH